MILFVDLGAFALTGLFSTLCLTNVLMTMNVPTTIWRALLWATLLPQTLKVYDNPMLVISTTEMQMQFVAMRNVKTPLDHIHVYVLEEVSSILVIRCLILHKLIRLPHAGLIVEKYRYKK